MMEQELAARWHPQASVGAQAATGNEIMDVRMKNERARSSVEHAEHAQLGAQAAGIAGQILQGLRVTAQVDLAG